MKTRNFIVIGVLFLFVSCLFGADLVRQGEGVSTIVLAAQPTRSARLAAHELQYHLAKMSGSQIEILYGKMPSEGTVILIGESRFFRPERPFEFQEYLVRVHGSTIVLAGCDDADYGDFDYADVKTFPRHWDKIGSLYAVYDFLELLGLRWYLPTDLGIAFVPSDTLSIGNMERRRKPTLEYRDMFYKIGNWYSGIPGDLCGDTVKHAYRPKLGKRETALWFFRRRHGGRELYICHSMYTYYKRFWPAKRAWFAQGYEQETVPPQMCYSHPEVLAQVVKDARDYFDGRMQDPSKFISNIGTDYQSDVFPVCPMDNTSRCKCSLCQSYPQEATRGRGMFVNDSSSDYFFAFVNKVARELKKSHPGKFVGTSSYWDHSYPPRRIRLEDNILLKVCLHSRHVFNRKMMEHQEKMFKMWKDDYPHMKKYVNMYWGFPCQQGKLGNFRVFPGFIAGHVGELFHNYRRLGMEGLYYEPSALYNGQQGVLFDQVESSINWSLAWDESRNPQALFDEFFRLYYGPAEKPMKAWYEFAESIYTAPADYKYQTEAIAWGLLGTASRMKKLGAYMAEAKKLADSEPYRSRVALFEKGIWRYMVNGKEHYDAVLAQGRSSMQQCSVAFVKNRQPGNPSTVDWQQSSFLSLYGGMHAEPVKWGLDVRMAHDGEWLYVSATESNIDPSKLTKTEEIWANDEWEFFFGEKRANPYHQLLVDANGRHWGVYKEGTATENWAFPGKVEVRFGKRHWKVLVAIPLQSLGAQGLKAGGLFYGNVIRSAGPGKPIGVWVPTFARYHAPERFGEFYLEPEVKRQR